MNNYEKIKSMAIEEMAEWLNLNANCKCCIGFGGDAKCEMPEDQEHRGLHCIQSKQKWLELGNPFPIDITAYIIKEEPVIKYEKISAVQTSIDCIVDGCGFKYYGKGNDWTDSENEAEEIVESMIEGKKNKIESAMRYHENELQKLKQSISHYHSICDK